VHHHEPISVTAVPSLTVKTIDCVHQILADRTVDVRREHNIILQYVALTLDVYQVCHCVVGYVKQVLRWATVWPQ